MNSLVSVIVAMHNAESTIDATLESLRAQSLADWEAIVVDDASTDRSARVVDAAARADSRIRLVSLSENRGPAGARNAGIDAARGRLIGFLDADDMLPAGSLKRLAGVCAAHPGACAAGGVEHRAADGEDLAWRVTPSRVECGLDDLLGAARLVIMTLTPRETLADDRFDESLTICEDQDLWLRLALRGVRFVTTPEVVYTYRLRPRSLTRRFASMRDQHERVMRRAFARARALGWKEAGVDCSNERLAAVLEREALLLATMAAAEGDHVDAGRILAPAWRGEPLDPLLAVDLGLWGVPYGACRSRHEWIDLPTGWLERLGAWWRHCEAAGWADAGFVDACAAMLPERLVTNECVADAMVEDLAGASRVALFGFGANARLLAERLLARGVRVEGRDDRLDCRALSLPEGVEPARMDAPLPARTVPVITPLQDAWLTRRLRDRAARAHRWSVARTQLIDRLRPAIAERMRRHADIVAV